MQPYELEKIIADDGPLTGAQLLERVRMEVLPLWQMLHRMDGVRWERAGRRYLRLDREVEGYARLSPSIRREFLTYTLIGNERQAEALVARKQMLQQEIQRISRTKFNLARETVSDIVQALPGWEALKERVCFLIAGDITYDMAHAVPRPEKSTEKMVRGSDLDIIVVADDDVPANDLRALDDAMLKKKHFLLVHPEYQEEIDYIVKRLAKVRAQLMFDTFEHMVASKILDEGQLLLGSGRVFAEIKALVESTGAGAKIRQLEQQAEQRRAQAEAALMAADPANRAVYLNLFYTREEGDEIY